VHGYWAQFAKLAVAHILAVISPGPDFAMVVRQSIAHGRRVAVWTAIGIGSAILIHVSYALLGIGILLRTYPLAFAFVKYVGAAYLAYIGVRSLMSRPRTEMPSPSGPAAAEIAAPALPTPARAWTTGVLTNVFNPKATLFFVAVFASLVDPRTPKLVEAGYGVWMSLSTMAWFALVATVFTRERMRRAFLRGGHWIDWAIGVVFIGLAAALAFASLN
jgi:RhtB (resistance to homoserine/threonine) family protein